MNILYAYAWICTHKLYKYASLHVYLKSIKLRLNQKEVCFIFQQKDDNDENDNNSGGGGGGVF